MTFLVTIMSENISRFLSFIGFQYNKEWMKKKKINKMQIYRCIISNEGRVLVYITGRY